MEIVNRQLAGSSETHGVRRIRPDNPVRWMLGVLMFCLLAWVRPAVALPPLDAPPPSMSELAGLARTHAIIAQSTPKAPLPLRVAFIGQSVTLQAWSVMLERKLKEKYPDVAWDFRNWGLAGFGPSRLLPTVDTALLEQYPDLVIFHAYAEQSFHARVIRRILELTTADVLIHSDHPSFDSDFRELPADEETGPDQPERWHNRVFLPALSRRTGTVVADIRTTWIDYLRRHGLSTTNVLLDPFHLNTDGNILMAETMVRYFDPPPGTDALDPFQMPGVTTINVGQDVSWSEGGIEFDFIGNRIDIIADEPGAGSFETQIDGRPLSGIPELIQHERPDSFPYFGWAALLKVRHRTPLLAETWRLTVIRVSETNGPAEFRVDGSETGFDGLGRDDRPFVSYSGRVAFETNDYQLQWVSLARRRPLQIMDEIRWRSIFLGGPEFVSPTHRKFTLAKGLPDGLHRFRIRSAAADSLGIRAFRIYSPAVRASDRAAGGLRLPQLQIVRGHFNWEVHWPAHFPDFTLESRADGFPSGIWTDLGSQHPYAGNRLRKELLSRRRTELFRLRQLPAAAE